MTRIEKNWENFEKFINGKTFEHQGKKYLAAHANFFDEIISDLVKEGFLRKVGWLSQIAKRKERISMPGLLPILGGQVNTYEILKPLETYKA